jgi:hypothetical protein
MLSFATTPMSKNSKAGRFTAMRSQLLTVLSAGTQEATIGIVLDNLAQIAYRRPMPFAF